MIPVLDYHLIHGDDYGSEASRQAKYRTVRELIGSCADILDVGCGTRMFRDWVCGDYTGIDLLEGTDVWDYGRKHEVVVANGVLYRLQTAEDALALIRHMWHLCTRTLVFTSLSSWGPPRPDGELVLDPLWTLEACRGLSSRIVLRHDYLPGDFTVALYR